MNEDVLKIIKHYGVNAQQRQLAEEVFELQEAITDYEIEKGWSDLLNIKVFDSNVSKKQHIAEEIADVLNMISEFVAYYELNEDEIYEIAYKKVARQLERIKKEVEHE